MKKLVPLTVATLQQEAYGVSIKKELESRLKQKLSAGAIQSVLKRMEERNEHVFSERVRYTDPQFYRCLPHANDMLRHRHIVSYPDAGIITGRFYTGEKIYKRKSS